MVHVNRNRLIVQAAFREHSEALERRRHELEAFQRTHRGPWVEQWDEDFLVKHKQWLGPLLDRRDPIVQDYLQDHLELTPSELQKLWKRIKENKVEYRIFNHGLEHPQYFRGHGLHGSYWQDTATGTGDMPNEALELALEQLGSGGWDVDLIKETLPEGEHMSANGIALREMQREGLSEEEIEEHMDWGEYPIWYVSVDIRQPDPPVEVKRRLKRH